ncbi:MAG: sensor histidine kinase [Deltaproteobacteria bacterium]|nr:sensor histidine kinase [Deltaproteobacteria bacterium]
MPAGVLLLGVASLAMLVWTDALGQRRHADDAQLYVLQELRLTVATAHLWLEEGLTNGIEPDLAQAAADLDAALRLADVLMNGGTSASGVALAPLAEPGLRANVEEISGAVAQWTAIARFRLQREGDVGEGSESENRGDDVFRHLQLRAAELAGLVTLAQSADHALRRRLFVGVFVAWAAILAVSILALLRHDRRRTVAQAALTRAQEGLEETVAVRTAELRQIDAALRLELEDRKRAEQALYESREHLQRLSARLLTAQETEQRRLAAELHDGLGHSLVLMKLMLGRIAGTLPSAAPGIETCCHDLAATIDEVLEDVRRLCRDLRPFLLEDLGLSAALRSLVGRYFTHGRSRVVSSVEDVDHLFSPAAQVHLYRIVQEALTNASKHAQAAQVELRLARQGDVVDFVVEDDGRGFDLDAVSAPERGDKGVGLATMQERARILGAALAISSVPGKGTRVQVGVPLLAAGKSS